MGAVLRDLGTRPVAEQVADLLARRLGQRHCLVVVPTYNEAALPTGFEPVHPA